MQFDLEDRTVGDLVELYRAEILKANPEYQRGIVWNELQKKKLIDSVLRGYPLPLIYLHYTSKTVAGMRNEGYEIIDGQQRIRSLFEFVEGAFKLFDPVTDAKKAKFPAFIKNQPCPWGGHDIHSLDPVLKDQLLQTKLAIAKIESPDSNEVRDLFVRLQSGLPLNHQETRDAWPGEFTEFILRLGGKPELPKYPGHEFFTKIMRMKPGADRGKTRQLAAQLYLLYSKKRQTGEIVSIGAEALNDFYYESLGFDPANAEAKRFVQILDKLLSLLQGTTRPKLHGHDAIHLLLLADALWDDYAPGWESKLPKALDSFQHLLAEAKRERNNNPGRYWTHYGVLTRVSSDSGMYIGLRHKFYAEEMLKFLAPLKLKDPKRLFGELERTVIFYRQNRICAGCGDPMDWLDCEIHHVEEHSKGGPTSLENGAGVHKTCHPKGAAATAAFAKKFRQPHVSPID